MKDSLKREKSLSEEVVNIMVSFPKAVLLASNISEKNASMEIKKELALHLFENKTLSFGKARQLASLTKWEFMDLLREKKIPLHYDIKEYEEDLETLKEI